MSLLFDFFSGPVSKEGGNWGVKIEALINDCHSSINNIVTGIRGKWNAEHN